MLLCIINYMFSYIDNTIIIPSHYNENIHKKIFCKYKNCNRIVFSNYTLIDVNWIDPKIKNLPFTFANDFSSYNFSSKKFHKFYSDNKSSIDNFYERLYIKSKLDISHNENDNENKFDNYYNIRNSIYYMRSKFDMRIDNVLPDNLQFLVLGWSFNKPVDNLPITLIEIRFGYKFNQLVDNLPFNLKKISFGFSFNQLINNLPNSIKTIIVGKLFNQPIDDLPNSLEQLELGSLFDHPINNLPISLLNLKILSKYHRHDIYQLPKKLNNITFVDVNNDDDNIDNYQRHKFRYNSANIKYKFLNKLHFY